MRSARWILCLGMLAVLGGCRRDAARDDPGPVVGYTSVDDIFARPVAERFQQETGIEVNMVFGGSGTID